MFSLRGGQRWIYRWSSPPKPASPTEVETRNGQIILTPVRVQRAGAVRAKLAELGINEQDTADAVAWARRGAKPATARRHG